MNSHKSLFTATVNLFSFIASLIFSHQQFHFFFLNFSLFSFILFLNERVLSLAVPSYDLKFQSKKEQANINCLRFFIQKATYKINKLKPLLFTKLIESSFCYSFAWLAIVTPVIKKCNSARNYILIFRKLFHNQKLIHIDWKPKIFVALSLLARLTNN